MNQRGFPLWFLRDWPAYLAFMIAQWTYLVANIIVGREIVRKNGHVSDSHLALLSKLLARCESRLDHAIWRQAWRACGYSAKHAAYTPFAAPTSRDDLIRRHYACADAIQTMEHLVIAYADDLRRRFKLSRAQVGDANAAAMPHRTMRTHAGRRCRLHICIPRTTASRAASPRATARGPPRPNCALRIPHGAC